MTLRSHLRALSLKNWLVWKREAVGSACEILFPVILIVFMLLLRFALPASHKKAESHLDDGQIIAPLWTANKSLYNVSDFSDNSVYPFNWCSLVVPYNWTWAYVITGNATAVDQKNLVGNLTSEISKYFVYYNTTAPEPRSFKSNSNLEDYITDSNYDDKHHQKICFSVNIKYDQLADRTPADVTLKIRYNATDTDPNDQTVYGTWYTIFLTSIYQAVDKYQKSVITTFQHNFVKSGFLHIQNIVYNYFLVDKLGDTAFLQTAIVPFHGMKYIQDNFMLNFAGTLGFFMFITSLVPVSRLINKITTEKETKVKEAMKMMGLTDTPYWVSWFLMYICIYGLISLLCTLVGWELFNYSNKFLVFILFFMYGMSCIAFSCLMSSFFSKAKTAILVGVLVFFVTYFTLFAVTQTTPVGTKVGLSIFNTVAMSQGFFTLLSLQGNQVEVNFSTSGSEFQNYSVQISIIMLTIDTVLYTLLALYFDKVVPSQYGVALKWYFPFTKSFWVGRKTNDSELDDAAIEMMKEDEEKRRKENKANKNFEEPDPGLLKQIEANQAMVVRGLRKHFGNKIAVDGIDLDMFRGQIFALLGHNGAGKTTTLSMLSGLLEPTSGSMTVDGHDFRTEMPDIRKNLGVCPQHDVLFKNLTVFEHLYMFCRFKGLSNKEEIKQAIDEKLKEVDLEDKRNTRANNLSGGQKRKLSLAIALIGGSSIVMLDEPTSGMDLTARRRVWDMLRNDRRGRIIILTTHYMEEADILADRIAIMSEGKVNCLGSPLFLKNRFGVGYNLTIVKNIGATDKETSHKIKELVQKIIPEAEVLSDVSAECTFQIPLSASPLFSNFFKELDKRRDDLKIEAYGMSVTTLEEVFLRVARGDDDKNTVNRKSIALDDAEVSRFTESFNSGDAPFTGEQLEVEDPTGKNFNIATDRERGVLFASHFWALTQKRIVYSWRDYKGFVLEILLPILLVMFGLALLTKFNVFSDQKSWKESLSKYSDPQNILYNNPSDNAVIENIMKNMQTTQGSVMTSTGVSAANLDDFDQETYNLRDHHPYRMGSFYFYEATNTQYSVVVFQNTTSPQTPPLYLNLIGNSVLQNAYGTFPEITLYNDPLPLTHKQLGIGQNTGTFYVSMIFSIGMAFIPTGLVTFIVKERENNVKHQHLVSGVSIPAYWLSSYAWDLAKYMIPGVVSVLLIAAFDLQSLTSDNSVFVSVWILFLLYGCAICPFTYASSFLFKSYSIAQFFIFIYNLITGAILATVVWTLRIISDDTRNVADVLQYIGRISSPIFCFGFGIMNVANRNIYESAYGESHLKAPLNWDIAGADVAFLVFHTVGGLIAIFIIEWISTVQWFRNIGAAHDPGENLYKPDDDVERVKAEVMSADPKSVAVRVCGIRKIYGSLFNKDQVKIAIQEISFAVPFQEAFALLGVNGAGKTSTFRILTGEYGPTKGSAHINGYDVIENLSEARYNIGYCPQFDALSELLTPTEHLRLYARIKGIPKPLVQHFVDRQLKDMGLEKYAKVRAGALSGGNKRKLSVAIACIGNPPVVFLDEPSAGMDPEARKNMWRVINAIKKKKVSIILTTHSMDEAEALCNNIAIMVGGRLRCYGTATHIKNKFSSGYELFTKVAYPSNEEISQWINKLKSRLNADVIKEADLQYALEILECSELISEISKQGSGSHIRDELNDLHTVQVNSLIEWCIIEGYGQKIYRWLVSNFNSISLAEHYGTYFKFRLEKNEGMSIGEIFGKIEHHKGELNVNEYSLSQTTLEQIFNMFATEGEVTAANARLSKKIEPSG